MVAEVVGQRVRAAHLRGAEPIETGVDHDPVFYDAESFKGSPHKIKAFHDQYPDAIGPPVNLQYWIDCYLEGKEPEDRIDDNGYTVKCQ